MSARLDASLKDGTIVDGESIFPEVMRGEIRSSGFDLNGSWSPLYTVHKLMAGLLDVHSAWGNPQALKVNWDWRSTSGRFSLRLNDEQMQQMLNTEYGGLNESFAELSAQSGDKRWLEISQRIYDHKFSIRWRPGRTSWRTCTRIHRCRSWLGLRAFMS